MALDEYRGTTFVAFLDIAGFTKKMVDYDKAYRALSTFYSIGYKEIEKTYNQQQRQRVEGLFVSDSGIIFIRNKEEQSIENMLALLLDTVKTINYEMVKKNYLLTTSIAYGSFEYVNRIEFRGIRKDLLIGSAYIRAYQGSKGMIPGQCRINTEGLSEKFDYQKCNRNLNIVTIDNSKYLYYYWMEKNTDTIELKNYYQTFEKNRKKKYDEADNALFKELYEKIKRLCI